MGRRLGAHLQELAIFESRHRVRHLELGPAIHGCLPVVVEQLLKLAGLDQRLVGLNELEFVGRRAGDRHDDSLLRVRHPLHEVLLQCWVVNKMPTAGRFPADTVGANNIESTELP